MCKIYEEFISIKKLVKMSLDNEKRSQLWSKALKEVYTRNKSETTTYELMSDEDPYKITEEMCTILNKGCDSGLNDFEEQNFGSKTVRISNDSSKGSDEDSYEEISVKKAEETYTLDTKGCESGLKHIEDQNFGSKTEVIASNSSKELDEDSYEEISVEETEETHTLEKKGCDFEEDINIKRRIHVREPCRNTNIDDFELKKQPNCANHSQNHIQPQSIQRKSIQQKITRLPQLQQQLHIHM